MRFLLVLLILQQLLVINAHAADVSLKGKACTDSEEWQVSNPAISKHEEFKSLLSDVPTSESNGLKKWQQLSRLSKHLAARPTLAGAWNYWYYRAAFALKMDAYAESGFLELQKKFPADHVFAQAAQSCLQVLKFKFRGVDQRSSYILNEKEDLAFFKALEGNDLKKVYAAFRASYDKARAEKNEQKMSAVMVMYAEDLYTRGKFKDAVVAAKKVDKKSDRYPQALLVQAWSAFREKDYAQAVGHSFSLMKSYPQSFEALEAVWMASAAFLESCLNKQSEQTLEFFKGQVLTLDEWIKKNQPAIMKDAYGFYVKAIQDKDVPFLIKREWLKSGRLYILQNHLNSLIDERAKAKEWKQEPGFYRAAEIERQLTVLQNYYQQELAKEFVKSTALVNKEIEGHIEKGQLLETDVLTALGVTEEATAAKPTDKTKKPSLRKKVIWARAGYSRGISDKKAEVWLDDIGNFVGDFKNACKP